MYLYCCFQPLRPFLTTFADLQKKHFFNHISNIIRKDIKINALQRFCPVFLSTRPEIRLLDLLLKGLAIGGGFISFHPCSRSLIRDVIIQFRYPTNGIQYCYEIPPRHISRSESGRITSSYALSRQEFFIYPPSGGELCVNFGTISFLHIWNATLESADMSCCGMIVLKFGVYDLNKGLMK